MILRLNGNTDDAISYILLKRPHYKWLEAVKKYSWWAKMHMTGIGKEEAIEKLDYYEDSRLLLLRQQNTPSNKDFYGRLHRPIDKIWSAKGGSINYNLPESEKRGIMDFVSNLKNGYNLKEWLKTYWLPAMQYDPTGLIMMETGDDETYPKYHPIDTIYEMPKPKGRLVKWVIFKLNRKSPETIPGQIADYPKQMYDNIAASAGYYRVIDDRYDRTIYWDGSTVKEIAEETYINYYGYVPAITCGNIWSEAHDMFISPDNNTFELAKNYMRQRGHLVLFEMQHGFPISWMYQTACVKCNGTGYINSDVCPSCNGTRIESKKDVSKMMTLPYPSDKDMPVIDKPGGYVDTAVDSWKEMKETVKEIFQNAHYDTWGTHQVEDSSHETATGRFIDVQPVNDRLDYFSAAAEYMFAWVVNQAAYFHYGVEKCCECNMGRRYMIETPDELSKKLQEAIKQGMSYSYLRDLYMRWLDSEYSGDENMRHKMIMEFKLDPAPFLSVQAAKTAFIDPADYQKKLYYGQWLETLPENWYLTFDYEYWKNKLKEYVDNIISLQPEIEPQQTETVI